MGTVHTTDAREPRTLIGAGATSEALQEAIDHAVEHGHELHLLGDDSDPAELLSGMQMVQALAAGHDLVCVWEVRIGRPIAVATILDPENLQLAATTDAHPHARVAYREDGGPGGRARPVEQIEGAR